MDTSIITAAVRPVNTNKPYDVHERKRARLRSPASPGECTSERPEGAQSQMEDYGTCLIGRMYYMDLYQRYLRYMDPNVDFNPFQFIKNLPEPGHRGDLKVCLPASGYESRMTLVLDLDETLVHSSITPVEDAELSFVVDFKSTEYCVFVKTRPFFKEFLDFAADNFEVIVFTASQRVYADRLLDLLDPDNRYFAHRVFREDCVPVNGNYLKDLEVLGRDLTKTCIVDNSPHAFGFHLENGVPIESWFDDERDEELKKLMPFLDRLKHVPDVRPVIRDVFQLEKLVHKS